MDLFAFPPIAAALDAAATGLLALRDALTPVAGGAAAVAAIVLVTLAVRAALIPVGISQARAEQTRARLAPRLRLLQKRYASSPERLQRETMQLYRDEGASPAAGCLPLLAQAPVLGIVYAVFAHPAIAGHANALLSDTLFSVPLGASAVGSLLTGGANAATIAVFGVLVALIAAISLVSARLLSTPAAAAPQTPPALRMLTGILPLVTAAFALFVPLAAGLYLVVTVAWTGAQRALLRRRFPLPRTA